VMDWDVLFLIPCTWAGPILAPLLVSGAMLGFALLLLYRQTRGAPLKASGLSLFGFIVAALVIIVVFCNGGHYAMQTDFRVHFFWSIFLAGEGLAILSFLRCWLKR
jgi:hypothetical protein